ncbi:hypothetical protein GD1_178 [Paraglaciecola Antarctic GD virus 1]|nr:hypothetical protein GD1_178 [Paraglaciecola Antarctic GD virus 1]
MSFIVSHVPRSLFRYVPDFDFSGLELKAFFDKHSEEYETVAMVEAADLNEAFERTNTIQSVWWENDKVTKLFDGEGCRSTSVGDVVITPDNKVFLVAASGFIQVRG